MKQNKQINPCGICGKDNPRDNFGCYNCGAPLDLEINTNEFGLPEIDQIKNPFEL